MNCAECQSELKGIQRKFCSRKCKQIFYLSGEEPVDISVEELSKIQSLYDQGLSLQNIANQTKYSKNKLWRMSAAGQIIIRSRSEAAAISGLGRQHSAESKRKISSSRKKFLADNPDMVPYKLNHKHKKISFPEQYFKECFGDVFHYQYRVGLYELDFADVENKIDIEIDGDQHFLDKKIQEHDKKRNLALTNLGWNVIRIKWSEFVKLTREEKELLVNSLLSGIIPINDRIIQFYQGNADVSRETFNFYHEDKRICPKCERIKTKTSTFCQKCDFETRSNKSNLKKPRKSDLELLISQFTLLQIRKRFGVSARTLKKWIALYKIEFPYPKGGSVKYFLNLKDRENIDKN